MTSKNLSNTDLAKRLKNVSSPRPPRQIPRRKKVGSDDMSKDQIILAKVKSLPVIQRHVPPRRDEIRSTNLSSSFEDLVKGAPVSPGRIKRNPATSSRRTPPRRNDVSSVHIRNSVLLSRLGSSSSTSSIVGGDNNGSGS